MQHPGFFQRGGPFPLRLIADTVGAELVDALDGGIEIDDLRPLTLAGDSHLTFCTSRKYAGDLAATQAGACLIKLRDASLSCPTARQPSPPRYPIAPSLLRSACSIPRSLQPRAAASAAAVDGVLVHSTAEIAEGVTLEPGAIVGREARIGMGTTVAAGAVVGYRVFIGSNCYIGPGASVTHALIGDRVTLHAGARIGQDGFGYAMSAEGHLKIPQIGRVIYRQRCRDRRQLHHRPRLSHGHDDWRRH